MRIGEPEIVTSAEGRAWSAVWLVDAPWAHPAWSQYALFLCELSTPMFGEDGKLVQPIRHLPEASHELIVHALGPDFRLDVEKPWSEQASSAVLLQGPNHGYQFIAENDEAARMRIQRIVDSIVAKDLSPDTDYRGTWNKLFADGYPLVRSGHGELFRKLG